MTAKVLDKAFDLLMINEGGYVNDANDSGGETKYGISKKAYPYIDIPNLTIEQAKEIYKKNYWDRCKCDYLPDALSVAVFDFAVNSGVNRAIRILQASLRIEIDGIIGNQTIGAVNRIPPKDILYEYMDRRLQYLMSLKSFARYGKGWSARVRRVREFCERLI